MAELGTLALDVLSNQAAKRLLCQCPQLFVQKPLVRIKASLLASG